MNLFVLVFIIAVIAGCTASTAMRTSNESYPAKDPTNVKIFLSEKPSQKYEGVKNSV